MGFFLQTDFDYPINKFGCYFMCLEYIKYMWSKPTKKQIMIDFDSGYIDKSDCYVKNPIKLISKTRVSKEKPEYLCKDGEFECLVIYNPNNKFEHFVLGDGAKYDPIDFRKHILYDPLGESLTVANKDSYVISKRIIY